MANNLTAGRAIRKFCIDCVCGAHEVRDCGGDTLHDGPCMFLKYRMGRGRPSVKLIRKFCVYCMGGHNTMVKDCPSRGCFLYPYRMGRSPGCPKRGAGRPFPRLESIKNLPAMVG
jgi:hypothetical protein